MSWVAAWFLGVGLADLLRAAGRPRAATPVALAALATLWAASDLHRPLDVVAALVAAVALVAWGQLAPRALLLGRGAGTALAVFGATTAAFLVAAAGAAPVTGLVGEWARANPVGAAWGTSPDRLLLMLGLAVVNLATANQVVRLVLLTVGAIRPLRADDDPVRPQPSDQLKGGRVIGPLERLLIIGLALAGEVTAAAVVVAAKGLLRFPELQAKRDDRTEVSGVGIDEVTEYFLVGSLVSWLFALAGATLVYAAAGGSL